MNTITQFLFILSNGLLIPVILLLCGGFLLSLLQLGRSLRFFAARRSFQTRLGSRLSEPMAHPKTWVNQFRESPLLHSFMSRMITSEGNDVLLHKALADFETQGDRQLQWPRILLRVGPMLGLMGTLIPMGPALLGLARGDIASMALNMQVAFSTTVIGIMVGAIGFFLNLVYGRWMKEDYNILEHTANCLMNPAHISKTAVNKPTPPGNNVKEPSRTLHAR